MELIRRLDDRPGKPSAIHTLDDVMLMDVYKEAVAIGVSDDFVELIALELKRRSLVSDTD